MPRVTCRSSQPDRRRLPMRCTTPPLVNSPGSWRNSRSGRTRPPICLKPPSTAANFLYESYHSDEGWVPPSDVPQGTAVFNSDPILRRLLDPEYTIGHWSE